MPSCGADTSAPLRDGPESATLGGTAPAIVAIVVPLPYRLPKPSFGPTTYVSSLPSPSAKADRSCPKYSTGNAPPTLATSSAAQAEALRTGPSSLSPPKRATTSPPAPCHRRRPVCCRGEGRAAGRRRCRWRCAGRPRRDWAPGMGPLGRRLAHRFWPGPLTLECGEGVADGLAGRLPDAVRREVCPQGWLRLRSPAHEAVLATLRALAGPMLLAPARARTPPTPTWRPATRPRWCGSSATGRP